MTHRWHNTVFGPTWESSDPTASACHKSERTWCSSCKLDLHKMAHGSEIKHNTDCDKRHSVKSQKLCMCVDSEPDRPDQQTDWTLCTNLRWSCIPAYCTSWVFLVWRSSHRGCLALQPHPAHLHSRLHAAAAPHRNSQSTAKSHTNSEDLVHFYVYHKCQPNIYIFLWTTNALNDSRKSQSCVTDLLPVPGLPMGAGL